MDVDDDKAAGEILRSLLITPKMENPQASEANEWHRLEPSEPIVWQIETNAGVNKQHLIAEMELDGQNVIQQIPVTYLTSPDERNLAFANTRSLIKPFTYILSRNDFGEGNVIVREAQQQIVLIQNVGEGASKTTEEESQAKTSTKEAEGDGAMGMNKERRGRKVNSKERPGERSAKKSSSSSLSSPSDAILLKRKERESRKDFCGSVKPKVDKKVNNVKKTLKKKKSKPKGKLKGNGKPFAKSHAKTVKTVDRDNEDEKNIAEEEEDDDDDDDEMTRKNLFELVKLEDNAEQVAERLKMGCDCADSNCFDGLNPEKVFRHRLNIADLTKAEHDMYLMGVIMASVQNLQETSRHKERIRIRSCYAYEGKKICLTAFLYLQHVTLYQMKRLRSHLKVHGVSPRIHGNRGRKPSNTFSLDTYRCATNFVQNYIEKRCAKSVPNFTTFSSNKLGNASMSVSSLPGARQGTKKCGKVKGANRATSYHLPSECTKKTVHKEYILFCERLRPGQKVMKYSTFTSFLQQQFPNVKFQRVDKRAGTKCGKTSGESRTKAKDGSGGGGGDAEEKEKNVQIPSVVYIPAKMLHVVQPTFHVHSQQQQQQASNIERP